MGKINRYGFRVETQDVDHTLRLSPLCMGRNILNVAGADAKQSDFGVDLLASNGKSWVLSRLALEIDSRPEQYVDYSVDTWVSGFSRVATTRNFRLSTSEGHDFAQGVSYWCVIDVASRAAENLMKYSDVLQRAVVEQTPSLAPPKKLKNVCEGESRCHEVVYSDMDFNGHVTTMRYVDLMFDMLPLDWYDGSRSIRLDVNFVAESRYGDSLVVRCCAQTDLCTFEITKGEGVTVCRGEIERLP